MHLGEERAADHPRDDSPQHQSNTDGGDDIMPEGSDQGLEAKKEALIILFFFAAMFIGSLLLAVVGSRFFRPH